MRKFVSVLVIFVLPVILLYPLDFLYSQIAMHSHQPIVESWYDIMHGMIDADVVAMGNSRARNHIDPAILDSILCTETYNIGFDGHNIDGQLHKYNLYRKFNKKPRLIIHAIDLWLFVPQTDVDKYQFLPYFWNRHMRKEFLPSETFSLYEKYLPFYRYAGNFEYFASYPQELFKGFINSDIPWDGSIYNKGDSTRFVNNEEIAKLFDEYLACIKSEEIKIVLVFTPLYYSYKKKIINQEEMYKTFQSYAEKYDIPLLDYTSMDICTDTSYFQNVSHLNRLGVRVFSDSLANDIKRLDLI